jgi:hypothetical protein
MADMLFDLFLGYPDVKKTDQQEHQRQKSDHFQKELAEIGVDLQARVKTEEKGTNDENGE